MSDFPFETHKVVVSENGREQTIVVPKSDDKAYDDYIIEAETEKSRNELRKLPPKVVRREARETLAEQIKEYKAYTQRKQEGGRKYY